MTFEEFSSVTTFEAFSEFVKAEMEKEGVSYTENTLVREMQHKLGNMAKAGLKDELSEKGIGQNDPAKGQAMSMVEAGQLHFCLEGFCQRRGFTLTEARTAADEHVVAKHG